MYRKVTALVVPLFFAAISIAQADTFTVPTDVPFASGVDVTDAVRNECTLQTRLPQFIAEGAEKGVDVVLGDAPAENATGKVLQLEFTNILGFGGGAWSGPKSVTVSGKLYENGQLIGSFVASRYSTGGAFAGFKGTCSILGRCVKTLGTDIARWLKKPAMDSRLGNA
jgi:hypothetical protein